MCDRRHFLLPATMNPKPRPNHQAYLQVIARMSPEQRLHKAFELGQMARDLFLAGLRRRFPDRSELELKRIYVERVALCHNRNY